jgi:hypothetical protein
VGQQVERGGQDPALLGAVTRIADGGAPIEARESGAWRSCDAGAARIPACQRGGDTVDFQGACDQSHGLRANRSGGDEQGGIGQFGAGGINDSRDGFIQHAGDIRLVAHKRDEMAC